MAYQLLRELMEQSEEEWDPLQEPQELPFVRPGDTSGILSATDLLTWWFRPTSRMADPWEDYFAPRREPISTTPQRPLAQRPAAQQVSAGRRPQLPGANQGFPERARPARPGPAPESAPWTDWQLLHPEPENLLEDDHAEAAVQCLYDFLHAISLRDVEAAMQLVADDYHVLEDDVEIDALGLRHQIERLLDSLRGWELQVSPVEIPMALGHVLGVLVYVEIQIDAYHPLLDLRRVYVQRRVAMLQWQSQRDWRISALSPV
ncbi:MAG: hypothetical protein M3441_01565 [Chloroflexota bacterium]|nr:hypothetical protein [Chloroflexota bacterium]